MKRFTDAGRAALNSRNWYGALTIALTLPDVCGSLQWPQVKSSERYKRWCDEWVVPTYTAKPGNSGDTQTFLSADDLYQVRCSLLHAGRSDIDEKKRSELHRIEFFDDAMSMHNNWFEINGIVFLQLDTKLFCDDMFSAVDGWDQQTQTDQEVQARKKQLLVIRTKGFSIIGNELV